MKGKRVMTQDPENNVWDVDYPDDQLQGLLDLHQGSIPGLVAQRDSLNKQILWARQRVVAYSTELARREQEKVKA